MTVSVSFVLLQVKSAAIIPPLVGTPDNYKQMYENLVVELNKRCEIPACVRHSAVHHARHAAFVTRRTSHVTRHTSHVTRHIPRVTLPAAVDEAARLRAALRMQGEEDVAKFRHVLLRELSAERERLQRVLDSKVRDRAPLLLMTAAPLLRQGALCCACVT